MKTLIIAALLSLSLSSIAQDTRPLCSSKTKAGIACKNKAKENSTHCAVHDPNASRCGFVKKDGEKCKMRVKVAGTRCHHHAGK